MLLIGVTGGIGTGKTTALQEFARLGASTLDADVIVHQLYAPGAPVTEALRERWGREVVARDGGIDRVAVSRLAFDSPAELAWLGGLVHPLVKKEILRQAAELRSDLFCGIPLLFEVGWEKEMSCTIAVWCDPAVQRRRLRERGWSEEEVTGRIRSQMGMDEKLTRADFGIINSGSRALLGEQCRRVARRIFATRQQWPGARSGATGRAKGK